MTAGALYRFCITLGLAFLLLGGGGVFANWKKSRNGLAVVFLFMFVSTVAMAMLGMTTLMMASGTMDPVAATINHAWNHTDREFRKELESFSELADNSVVYCRDTASISECDELYVSIEQYVTSEDRPDHCSGPGSTFAWDCALAANCSQTLGQHCYACDSLCEQAFTADVKGHMESATTISIVALVVMVCCDHQLLHLL